MTDKEKQIYDTELERLKSVDRENLDLRRRLQRANDHIAKIEAIFKSIKAVLDEPQKKAVEKLGLYIELETEI